MSSHANESNPMRMLRELSQEPQNPVERLTPPAFILGPALTVTVAPPRQPALRPSALRCPRLPIQQLIAGNRVHHSALPSFAPFFDVKYYVSVCKCFRQLIPRFGLRSGIVTFQLVGGYRAEGVKIYVVIVCKLVSAYGPPLKRER